MNKDIDTAVEGLERQAHEARSLLRYASRAFVIEFGGTPKSGKSTSIEAIRYFFIRHGFRVRVLTERASLCPIPMKGHLFFNTWCACSMLADLLEHVDSETDVILIDRGLIDALVWMTLQGQREELTYDEARTIESFLLLERWSSLIDLGVMMNVSSNEAIRRENSHRITSKAGSIMNPEVLSSITSCVDKAIEKYGARFRHLIKFDNSNQEVRESLVSLTSEILTDLEKFLNPEILVLPRNRVERLCRDESLAFGAKAVAAAIQCVKDYGHFVPRHTAEEDSDCVQIVPCGVLEHCGRVFLFRRGDADPKYRLYGRATVWQGCHVSRRNDGETSTLLEQSLLDRICRSLFLSRVFPVEPRGYCWDEEHEISSRHFGIVYTVKIDNAHTAIDLRKKEFRRRRGHGLTGQFLTLDELSAPSVQSTLESWSHEIVKEMRLQK